MDGPELELFRETLRQAVHAQRGFALDAALADLGWHDALAEHPRSAVALLFELQGRAGTTSSALDDVTGAALGAEGRVAIVLPGLGRAEPPGSGDMRTVVVNGLGTKRLRDATTALVVTAMPAGECAAVVSTAELRRRPLSGIDPDFGMTEVTGTATVLMSDVAGESRWPHAVRHARLALGHELVGASSAMLELAHVHALERMQFGRPIAAFQAVRHRLAETLVAVESARALLDAAWDDAGDETAAMAKALAGRSARTTARHCQQVLAGMGFTTEHPLHRYVRRVLLLDELFGSSRTLTASLGRQVLASRRLPAPIPL